MNAPLAVAVLMSLAAPASAVDVAPSDQLAAADALVGRVMGPLASQFETLIIPDTSGKGGTAQLGVSPSGKIALAGSSGVEIARALNFYLNDILNITYDWNTYAAGQMPASGTVLPLPASTEVHKRRVPWSYYMNVCTYGYSLAFIPWDASDTDPKAQSWVKHIDWMALQGINLPLSFVGQEYIWTQVFASYNLTFAEQQTFYGGPAFLPWFRMGNIRGWGGPLSMEWILARRDLQILMLTRMRSLGMRTVLSAFAGHVPAAFATRFPTAKITRSPDWANFNAGNPATAAYSDVYMIDPTDPMYTEVGAKFIETQASVYGTDHIYNCDTYNEMEPPTRDPTYLKSASAAVYGAMVKADPDATWLMQAWLFINEWWTAPEIEAYLGGVAPAKMWLLDLFGDSTPIWSRTASMYGHPFIWCTLLNFGGQQGIWGNANSALGGLQKAIDNSTITGVGITMEGIWTNYPMFEVTLQGAYGQPAPAEIPAWWSKYGRRRYGDASVTSAVLAWDVLGSQIYAGSGSGCGSDISSVAVLPSLPPKPPSGFYDNPPGDGFYNGFVTPPNNTNQKIEWCAKVCVDATPKRCLGFEVFINIAPDVGNCYIFYDITTFSKQVGSACYLRASPRSSESSGAVPTSGSAMPAVPDEEDGVGYGDPRSMRAMSKHQPGPDLAVTETFKVSWKLLMAAAPQLEHVASFRFDLVDVAREVISANFTVRLAAFKQAYGAGNLAETKKLGGALLEIIDDYDLLLSADTNFMLGRWLEWAGEWSNTTEGKQSLDFNARNILTLWGPTGQITDYAKKEWGGLVRSYYRPRYALFVSMAVDCLVHNASWSQAAFSDAVFKQVELPWQTDFASTPGFPVEPETDLIVTATMLYGKYA